MNARRPIFTVLAAASLLALGSCSVLDQANQVLDTADRVVATGVPLSAISPRKRNITSADRSRP
jgi:hypothetical protein